MRKFEVYLKSRRTVTVHADHFRLDTEGDPKVLFFYRNLRPFEMSYDIVAQFNWSSVDYFRPSPIRETRHFARPLSLLPTTVPLLSSNLSETHPYHVLIPWINRMSLLSRGPNPKAGFVIELGAPL